MWMQGAWKINIWLQDRYKTMTFMSQWAQLRQGELILVNALNVNKEKDSLLRQAETWWQDAAVFSLVGCIEWAQMVFCFLQKILTWWIRRNSEHDGFGSGIFVHELLEIHRVLSKLDICDKKKFNLFQLTPTVKQCSKATKHWMFKYWVYTYEAS